MKKNRCISFILTVILLLMITPIASIFAVDDGENAVLVKSTFDDGTFEGWSAFGGKCTLDIDSVHSHSGSGSLAARNREEYWSGPVMNITKLVQDGDVLEFKAHVQGAQPIETKISMVLKITDINSTDDYQAVASVDSSMSIWTSMNGTFEVPPNTVDIMVYFEADEKDLDFYVDDFSITRKTMGQVTTAPAHSKNAPEYTFDFEDSAEGWLCRGDMDLSISKDFCYTGKKSLYASERTKVWNGPTVRLERIVPGKKYTYSAYVMYNGREYENRHNFSIELQYSLNGEEIYMPVAYKELQKGTWSKLSGSYAVPEGASDIYMYIQTEFKQDEEVSFDDLMSFYVDCVDIIDSSIISRREMTKTLIKLSVFIAVIIVVCLVTVLIVIRSKKTKAAIRSASIDYMTKAFNRNAFETRINELSDDPDDVKGLYITACDVNFLKYINDNYGHECGDKAITRCSAVLMRAIGKKGKVYRTGGDEFVCLCSADVSAAIRKEFDLESATYEGYPFTIAIGTIKYDPERDGDTPDINKLMSLADQEMYTDKVRVKKEFSQFSGMDLSRPVILPAESATLEHSAETAEELPADDVSADESTADSAPETEMTLRTYSHADDDQETPESEEKDSFSA